MKTLGIIGGLGPMATAYFLELLTGMSAVENDQGHMKILLESIPMTPDRTAYILDHRKDNPLPSLIKAGKEIKEQGADFIAIPCVTAHYFYKKLSEEIQLPIISLVDEMVKTFVKLHTQSVGLLATSGTIKSRILQDALVKEGIACIVPDDEYQKMLMKIIYEQIKAGDRVDIEMFEEISDSLRERGAEKLLLGCTELSLIKRDYEIKEEYIDILEILARAAIVKNNIKVKEYYRQGDRLCKIMY